MAVIGTGGTGSKYIRTSYKEEGYEDEVEKLVPEESLVSEKEKVGLS